MEKVYLLKTYVKATSYINDAIRDKQFLQSIKYYGTLRRYNWCMP